MKAGASAWGLREPWKRLFPLTLDPGCLLPLTRLLLNRTMMIH
jgi:hypothetical protein